MSLIVPGMRLCLLLFTQLLFVENQQTVWVWKSWHENRPWH